MQEMLEHKILFFKLTYFCGIVYHMVYDIILVNFLKYIILSSCNLRIISKPLHVHIYFILFVKTIICWLNLKA